jgi:hypothetical protein
MQQIIAKCWSDEAFKEKLVADPHVTLAAEGVDIPEGVNINVLSNNATTMHLVIPEMQDDRHRDMDFEGVERRVSVGSVLNRRNVGG